MALRAPLPTGTITLLFTDIEGSTQHWEQQRVRMPHALRRHDELMRSAIEGNGGYVFKTVGDEFCAAFWRPSDALAAAIGVQRGLAGEDWSVVGGLQVRVALHSGTTDERDGDYFGPSVNRVARLLGVAHGGQTVVSGTTALLLRGLLPEQAELRDLGEHRLRDLVEPERVWQVVAPGLTDAFPPLRSLDALPNNLPRQVTPLVGRDELVGEIEPLVRDYPLVTLVGTGGVGKTRLALQIGANLLDASSDGVWLVELAALSNPGSVADAIASTLRLREQPEREMLDVLVQYLRSRQVLLILDNCEHLIEEAARVVDALVRAAAAVRVLVTSREPLRITAEQVYRVPSLAVPPELSLTRQEALRYGAIALFAERAKASDVKFELTDATAPIVAEICRRLDGIALAIELASARVKVLPPRQLAQKLDERFRVLTGGSRTALPRQQTMRALIDWSHDLLLKTEQVLFRRLAIFAGGWTLEAVETVCCDEILDWLDAVDLVSSLVEKSLVIADAQEPPRYRFLESIHAFALEKLTQSGERAALAHRHAQWAAALGDRAEAELRATPSARWAAEFACELENARCAIDWSLAHDEVVLAARILAGFASAYFKRGRHDELKSWLAAVLDRLDARAHPALAARAWHASAFGMVALRRIEASQRAAELAESCNDTAIALASLSNMAFGLLQARRLDEAQAVISRAMTLSRKAGCTRTDGHALALNVQAILAADCGRPDDARASFAEALALAEELGDDLRAASLRLDLAELEFQLGDTPRALELAEGIEAGKRGLIPTLTVTRAQSNIAAYRIVLGDLAGARVAAHDALRLARGVYADGTIYAIAHLAAIAAAGENARRAARLRGYVDAWYRDEGCDRECTERRTNEILMRLLHERLSEAEIEALAADGAVLSEDQALSEAFAV